MRIAQLAPLWESVPPAGYGGTERVVSYLTEELVRLGHEVTLFAAADSKTGARLVPVVERPLRAIGERDGTAWHFTAVERAFDPAERFDVVHSHVDLLAFPAASRSAIPSVHTLHGRLDFPHTAAIFPAFPSLPFVSISDSQRAPHPRQNWIATIHNGIPAELLRFRSRPGNYLVFVGRMSPEKRPEWAIDVAERAGIPLRMAAKIDPADREYFEQVVRPRIDRAKDVEFLGEVDDSGKDELIGGALALVMPIDWPEPFGLTAIEALACGTPVLARPCGALPEILVDGVTGFLRDDVAELAELVPRITEIDRAACRARFEEKFSARSMAAAYLAAYARAADGWRTQGTGAAAIRTAAAASEAAPESSADAPPDVSGAASEGREAAWTVLDSALASSVPKLTTKDDAAFVVTDPFGDVTDRLGGEFGFYWRGTRHLSRLSLTLSGRPLVLLDSGSRGERDRIVVDAGNDLLHDDGGEILPGTLHLRREIRIDGDELFVDVVLTSWGDRPIRASLELVLAADFADVFEVRGVRRPARGRLHPAERTPNGLGLSYDGLDGVHRRTVVTASPPPEAGPADRLRWAADLRPRGTFHLSLAIRGEQQGNTAAALSRRAPGRASGKNRRFVDESPEITTSDPLVTAALAQAVADLGQLVSHTEDGPYPTAGIPWYCALFGRDSILTALQLLPYRPDVAASTARLLARLQGEGFDDFTDCEPGKILHELREGEMANLREIPFVPYFGTVDATPLFVHLVRRLDDVLRDRDLASALWPAALRAAAWMRESAPLAGDGLLDYAKKSRIGLRNQGWKDSWDSVFHEDGTLAEPPIALVEVQAYGARAFEDLAEMARRRGEREVAPAFERDAARLRRRIDQDFWMEDESTYGIALDGERRLCRIVTTNAGHALFCGVVPPERAARVAERLLREDVRSGFGLRTLSAAAARYNPASYHDGSVWPHDNSIVSSGFRRYGLVDAMGIVHDELIDAVRTFRQGRVPELWCGFPRDGATAPVSYPTACAPQAWSSGALLDLVTQSLDLTVSAGRFRLGRIRLPAGLDWLRIRRLRGADGDAELLVRRHGERFDVESSRGPIEWSGDGGELARTA